MLGIVKADTSLMRDNMTEVKSFDAPKRKNSSAGQEMASSKINGPVLQSPPEWKGKYWYDESGRIRSSLDRRRPPRGGIPTRRPGEIMPEPLDLMMMNKLRWESKTGGHKGTSWKKLLNENRSVVDELTSKRLKTFGLNA